MSLEKLCLRSCATFIAAFRDERVFGSDQGRTAGWPRSGFSDLGYRYPVKLQKVSLR
jgi:hypothetical protein